MRESVEVKRGIAKVVAGQTVRAGEVLISGIIPDELGGGAVTPTGKIIGRVALTEQIEVPRVATVTEYGGERLFQTKINILSKEINIFKKYSNSQGKYDIISLEDKPIYLFGVKLPISILKSYTSKASAYTHEYTDGELITLCARECARARARITALGEVVSMRCDTALGEDGITVTLDALYLTEIGAQ